MANAAPPNHMSSIVVQGEIEVLGDQHRQNEPAVGGLWAAVIAYYFPGSDGYAHRPQYAVPGGLTDMTTAYWHRRRSGVLEEREFLVTQFKKMSWENSQYHWGEAEGQLTGYMRGVYHRRSPHRRGGPLWGLITIGKFAQFYQFDPLDEFIVLKTRGGRGRWHVQDDADIIQTYFETIAGTV